MADSSDCELCGRLRPVMIAMKPGADGVPWRLCSSCYLMGIRPMDYDTKPEPKPPLVVTDPKMVDALRKSGWKEVPAEPKKKRKAPDPLAGGRRRP